MRAASLCSRQNCSSGESHASPPTHRLDRVADEDLAAEGLEKAAAEEEESSGRESSSAGSGKESAGGGSVDLGEMRGKASVKEVTSDESLRYTLKKVETWNQKGETNRGNRREGNRSNSIGIQFVDAVLNQKIDERMAEFHRIRGVPRFSSPPGGVPAVHRCEEVGVDLLATRGDGLRAGKNRGERKSNAKEFAAQTFSVSTFVPARWANSGRSAGDWAIGMGRRDWRRER